MSKVLGSQIQIGASGTAANNLVLDASANNGSASVYMGAPGTPVVPVGNILPSGILQFLSGIQIGPLGGGSGVVTNANGTAIQLPGGYIAQFGVGGAIAAGGNVLVTFPVPFPNACCSVVANPQQNANTTSPVGVGISSNPSKTGFTAFNENSVGAIAIFWLAIGN